MLINTLTIIFRYRLHYHGSVRPVVIIAVCAAMPSKLPNTSTPSFQAKALVVPVDFTADQDTVWAMAGVKDLKGDMVSALF